MATESRHTQQDLAALEADFLVRGEIARGGMSVVYRALDRQRGIEVAVKVLRARYTDDEDAFARFTREARVAVGLEHPNIVRTYELRELAPDALALVMQFVDGDTLRHVLRETSRLPVPRAERILRDIADALGYAHRRGIVHRDVKPENIFLESSGRALLSDFGIALSLDADTHLTRTGVAIGTPNYMAPEQIDGPEVDGRSDLYSLGLVGWEMLSGSRPWEGESLYGVLYKQKGDYLPLLDEIREDVPASYLLAIEGALAKDPDSRWTRAEEMSEQLAEAPLKAAVRRRRAIAQGKGIYAHSRAGREEATIRMRLPKASAPPEPRAEDAGAGAPAASPRTPPRAAPAAEDAPARRSRTPLVLACVAFLVLATGATLAALRAPRQQAGAAAPAPPAPDVVAAPTPTPAAIQLVRGADAAVRSGDAIGIGNAIGDYERALELGAPRDPVLGKLALTYALLAEQGGRDGGLREAEVLRRATSLADSATRLAPRAVESAVAHATVLSLGEGLTPTRWSEAIARARAADAAHPELRRLTALGPAFFGRPAEAEQQLERLVASGDGTPGAYRDLAELLLARRDARAAKDVTDRGIALFPRASSLYAQRSRAALRLGLIREAWSDAEIAARLGDVAAGLSLYVLLDATAGDTARARTRARELMSPRPTRRPATLYPTQAVAYAAAFAALGDPSTAFDALARARPRGARFCLTLGAPELDPLRADARFRRLLRECTGAR